MIEQTYQQHLRIALSRIPGVRIWRQPAGRVRTDRGTQVECAPVGAADLTGIVGPEGWRLELEVKGADTKTTIEQTHWGEVLTAMGAIYLLLRYDAEETLEANLVRAVEELTAAIEWRRASSRVAGLEACLAASVHENTLLRAGVTGGQR